MTSAIVRKYAQALAEVAIEQNESAEVANDLAVFKNLYASQEELRGVLGSPALPLDIKRNILEEVLERITRNESVHNFLILLLDRDRLEQIEDLVTAYQEAIDRASGLVQVEVLSSKPLDSILQKRLDNVMTDITGKQVRLHFEVDKDLIGGVRIQVGSTVYDGTIKTRLEELERILAVPG